MSQSFPNVSQTPPVASGASEAVAYTQTSVAAVTSMVFGIMSPIVLCTCLPTIVTSAAAVVLGHIALFKIGRSKGMLVGKSRAITGLVLGYLFLVLSIYLAPTYFSRIQNWRDLGSAIADARTDGSTWQASEGMRGAESKIVSARQGISHGNNSKAVGVARDFAALLKRMKEETIVRTVNGRTEESDDQFVTFCQVNSDSVCFLVHIPEYRKYETEAKDAVAQVAWMAASEALKRNGMEEMELGVGLKGILFYGATMTGNSGTQRPTRKSDDREMLSRFFE